MLGSRTRRVGELRHQEAGPCLPPGVLKRRTNDLGTAMK